MEMYFVSIIQWHPQCLSIGEIDTFQFIMRNYVRVSTGNRTFFSNINKKGALVRQEKILSDVILPYRNCWQQWNEKNVVLY